MPWKRIRKLFNAFERNQKANQCLEKVFWCSERPVGLIERLIYWAPKNEGRTINKCAPIITVVSVLSLTNCCLRIKVSWYKGK
jgi:hypothetical protein